MSSELKQIQITGGAADDYKNGTKSGKRRRSRKNKTDADEETGGGVSIHQTRKVMSGGDEVKVSAQENVKTELKEKPREKPVPTKSELKSVPKPEPNSVPIPFVAPKLILGTTPTKGGKAHQHQHPHSAVATGQLPKIHLAPPKAKSHHHQVHSNTKKARKIRVSLSGLGKRITRHKTIQKEAKGLPLDKIKTILEEAKLLKPNSKAPESMIRQIYADYQTLKNKAL